MIKVNKYILALLLLSLLCFNSCIIESYPYFEFLEPINYQKSVLFHGENINSTIYSDEGNNVSLDLVCFRSNGDTLDYYLLYFSVKNISKDTLRFKLPEMEMYSEDYILRPEEYTEKITTVGAYDTKYNTVFDTSINPNDSLWYYTRFQFSEKNKSFSTRLAENNAEVIVTNIIIEKDHIRLQIPDFYYKD